jgi:hypothetical protein
VRRGRDAGAGGWDEKKFAGSGARRADRERVGQGRGQRVAHGDPIWAAHSEALAVHCGSEGGVGDPMEKMRKNQHAHGPPSPIGPPQDYCGGRVVGGSGAGSLIKFIKDLDNPVNALV